jgi:hypothetical protein
MTLVELIIGIVASIIVIFAVAALLISGHRGWNNAFKYANGDIQVNAIETMINFGITGRKSNKSDYKLYKNEDGTYEIVKPLTDPEEVVFGDAIEFRYWDEELNDSLMDTDKTGTAYALYYVEDDMLKVDRGPYNPAGGYPGGVDSSGNKTETDRTLILARNVQSAIFSHTTKNADGDGKGCVKLDLWLYDPNDDQDINIKTATLMRNVWP